MKFTHFKFFFLLFLILLTGCNQEEDFLTNPTYNTKSLWKEDESFILNVKKVFEENSSIISENKIVGSPLWDYALTDNYSEASILEVPISYNGDIISLMIVIRNNDRIYFFNGYNQRKINFYENLTNPKLRKSVAINNNLQARRECTLKEVTICTGEGAGESCRRDVNLVCVSKPADIDTCLGVIDPFTGECGAGGGGGYPYPDGGGSESNEIPLSEVEIKAYIENKPFIFMNDVPCETIKEWLKTANHQVRNQELDKLKNITKTSTVRGGITTTTVANLQDINNAYSTVVNMDYFPVTIDKLPIGTTAEQFLNYIRKNINSFVDTSYSKFEPYHWYGVDDRQLWNSSNPLGTVIGIDILGPDNGSVVVTKYSSSGWTFSTIYDPKYGIHPVSGHRDFGFKQNSNGSYTFYTRGVDRLTTGFDSSMESVAFLAADTLWKSFQNKISDYVNSNGGKANVTTPQIERPYWQKVKDVLDGKKPLSTLSNDCK